ncbi:hypothetical protein ACEWY4_014373 [Coilia grayii]|uniref:HECT-type E3 ubiquitin transferase n=1 Tax=Coilia grayii TaxID=363190 RepID=A0ABD1JS35_9TELE
MDEAGRATLNQAISALRGILSSPQLANISSSANLVSSPESLGVTVDREMSRLFPSGTPATAVPHSSLRYDSQRHFGNFTRTRRKRVKTQHHDTFIKDVILLPGPKCAVVVKHKAKHRLHQLGHILNGFEFQKSWSRGDVEAHIRHAFVDKLPPDISCEEENPEENQPSLTAQANESFPSGSAQQSSSTVSVYVADDDLLPSTSSNNNNYNNYLSVLATLSDVSSEDEELQTAMLASLQSERATECTAPPVKEILHELATKITDHTKSKFNISRSNVLDGVLRGFKRGSYQPQNGIMVRFSDDLGFTEEAVDLGGPKREFLRLLIQALSTSSMFEGEEGKKNLTIDSIAMREDRYFFAGRAIAVSLIHGGPPACFVSPTLFSCLVHGPDRGQPVLEDIVDVELRDKIKRIADSETMDELRAATLPLEDYLASAGCLRPLRRLEDKTLLVKDLLMFQVIHRVRGPFESLFFFLFHLNRFRDGLRTLGLLDKIQAHPESFRPVLCWVPSTLDSDVLDNLFIIRRSAKATNRWNAEDAVIPFWRDYLCDAEAEGTEKLASILIFATGASRIPPLGFAPQPSIEFLHSDMQSGSPSQLPMANTCINCLKLPLHTSYNTFKTSMDFALGNTHGFGLI